MVLQLTLNVIQQSACPKAEHLSTQPRWAKFFLDHGQPIQRLLRGTDSTCWLESHRHSGLLRIVANRSRHNETDWKRGIHSLFPGRSLDEVRSSHHGHDTCACHVPKSQQVASA